MNPVAHHYPSTMLRFGPPPALEVDLRRAVRPAVVGRLRALGLGARFGIITPFNPGGRTLGAAENGRRLARLSARIRRHDLASVPADGWSIDGRHVERGFAIRAPRADLVALARAFEQTALFWFDGRRFLLVWCAHPARGQPLPAQTL